MLNADVPTELEPIENLAAFPMAGGKLTGVACFYYADANLTPARQMFEGVLLSLGDQASVFYSANRDDDTLSGYLVRSGQDVLLDQYSSQVKLRRMDASLDGTW